MPRFVILEHDFPVLHWDLMLEADGVLRTWRLAKAPDEPGESVTALAIADHRIFYLDHEGPVSGDRGRVRRWDSGRYELVAEAVGQEIQLHFTGARLRGPATLTKDASCWCFHVGEG